VLELESVAVGAAVAEAPYPAMYEGEYVSVPTYPAQPGTVVLGGARPPPQSSISQTSPVPGTYQATEAPAGEDTSVLVQPSRSVRARAKVVKARRVEMEVRILVVDGVVVC
jgi:hypothetical protein